MEEYRSGRGREVMKRINAELAPRGERRTISTSSESDGDDNDGDRDEDSGVDADDYYNGIFPRSTVELIESDGDDGDGDSNEPPPILERINPYDNQEASTSGPGIHASDPTMRPRYTLPSPPPQLRMMGGGKPSTRSNHQEKYLIGKRELSCESEIKSFFSCLAIYMICQEKFNGKLKYVKRYRNKANRLQQRVQTQIPNLVTNNGRLNFDEISKLNELLSKSIRIWDPIKGEVSDDTEMTDEQFLTWPEINLELSPTTETFALIKSIPAYCGLIFCEHCTQRFKYMENKITHLRDNRCPFKKWQSKNPKAPADKYFDIKTKNGQLHFKQGIYKPKPTIYDLLYDNDIITYPEKTDLSQKLLNPYLAVFDIESHLSRMDHDPTLQSKSSIEYEEKHSCISVSVCSNVPGFQRIQTFIAKQKNSDVAKEFLSHLYEIGEQMEAINTEKYQYILDRIANLETLAKNRNQKWKQGQLENIKNQLVDILKRLPVLGWNSSRYDLIVLIRSSGLAYWIEQMEGQAPVSLKKGPREYLLLKSERFQFLDLLNFLGTKTSLRSFLRQMKIPDSMGKMVFPYSILSDHKSLFNTDFPPYESFFSNLTQSNVLEDDWKLFKEQRDKGLTEAEALEVLQLDEVPKTGKQNYRLQKKQYKNLGCKYIWQLLGMYNSFDVLPVVDCAEMLRQRYFELTGVDCFKYVTISSLAFPYMIKQAYEASADDWNFFAMLSEEAFDIISRSVMGGISHCFNKIGVTNYTELEPHIIPPDQREKCKQIASWDANMMYPGSAGHLCSNVVGHFSIRRRENGFVMDNVMGKPKLELMWLKVEEIRRFRGRNIRTALSPYGQKTLLLANGKRHKADGWIKHCQCGYVVLEFDGCMYHGCPKCYPNRQAKNPKNGETYQQLYDKTMQRNAEIRQHPDVTELITIWEHEFVEELRTNHNRARDLAQAACVVGLTPPPIEEDISWERMSQLICDGKIHGFVECSIEVPQTLEMYKKYSTFPPFFTKEEIGVAGLYDEKQKNYAKSENLLANEQEFLLSTMKVENTVIATPLFAFYVEELGLKVTNVETVVQFRKAPVLRKWLDTIKEGRQKAKQDGEPTLTLAYKALGNHAYGFGLLNLLDRDEIRYVSAAKKERFANRENCSGYVECGPEGNRDQYYEFSMKKTSAQQLLPKQVSADILSCAKIPLLKCVYSMFYKYFRRSAWSLLAMDTDSVVVMLAEDSLVDCCKPELKAEFQDQQNQFFVPLEGAEAKKLAMEPLLFKQEFRADIAISLAPKLYLFINLADLERKMASKGFRRTKENQDITTLVSFFNMLFHGRTDVNKEDSEKAMLRGMRVGKDGELYTYKQPKRSLTKLSPKFSYCDSEIHCFPRELMSTQKSMFNAVYPYQCRDDENELWDAIGNMISNLPNGVLIDFIFG